MDGKMDKVSYKADSKLFLFSQVNFILKRIRKKTLFPQNLTCLRVLQRQTEGIIVFNKKIHIQTFKSQSSLITEKNISLQFWLKYKQLTMLGDDKEKWPSKVNEKIYIIIFQLYKLEICFARPNTDIFTAGSSSMQNT